MDAFSNWGERVGHDPPTPGLTHRALVYSSDEEFLATVAPFIADGLEQGDPVLVATTSHNVELVLGALGRAATRPEVVLVLMTDLPELPLRKLAALDGHLHRLGQGRHHVRVVSEPEWPGRSELEAREMKRFESTINVVLASFDASLMCPYDTRVLDGSIVADALRTHPEVARGMTTQTSPAFQSPLDFWHSCDSARLPEPTTPVESLAFRGDLRRARQFVREHAGGAGLPPERVWDLVRATNELTTNIVRHGSGRGTVRVWVEPGEVVCEVSNPEGRITAPFPGYVPPGAGKAGCGLWTARQLCDIAEIRSGEAGCTVRLHAFVD